MLSLKFIIAAAATLVVSVSAQEYYIDPNSIILQTRQSWCTSQEAACPLLCTQLPGGSLTTAENTCDPVGISLLQRLSGTNYHQDLLTYTCVCGSGDVPNTANYSMTLPYFKCTQWVQNCVTACGAAQTSCQSACTQQHPCGAQNPTRYNITSTSSTVAATGTGSHTAATSNVVFSGPGTTVASDSSPTSASSTQNNQNAAQSMVAIGRSYGLASLAAGIFAGFAIFM